MGKVFKNLKGTSNSQFRISPGPTSGPPNAGPHRIGDEYCDSLGNRWFCVNAGGTPSWIKGQDISTGVALTSLMVVSASRNSATTTNIWLRNAGNVPMNKGPFRMPFSARLAFLSATTGANETCTFEVYKNADVRGGGNPNQANLIASLGLVAQKSGSIDLTAVPVSLVVSDEIGVFIRGNSINRPVIRMLFAREF